MSVFSIRDVEQTKEQISRHLAMRVFMHITSGGEVASLFELDKTNDLVRAHQEYFLLSLEIELLKEQLNSDANGESYYKAINNVIENEFIIGICKSKGIPYTGVTIAPDQFSMRNCGILCEDCDRMKQYIQSITT